MTASKWLLESPRAKSLRLKKPATRLVHVPRFYDYADLSSETRIVWHVNFADPDLFCAYGSDLFAQDEIQCLEHPLLGALCEAITESEDSPETLSTIGSGDIPTPLTITGVDRWLDVATTFRSEISQTYSIYGNNFAVTPESIIRQGVTFVKDHSASNILAMAAPSPEEGPYTYDQIAFILETAIAGFGGAVRESGRVKPNASVTIHTGHWGCGAFGGNPELMLLCQMLAASIAGVDELHVHATDAEPYGKACERMRAMEVDEISLGDLAKRIEAIEFEWGVADGN